MSDMEKLKNMEVGQRIKEYTSSQGIKQKYLAKRIGVDDSQMSKILNGTREININEYLSICHALNVPIDKFVE